MKDCCEQGYTVYQYFTQLRRKFADNRGVEALWLALQPRGFLAVRNEALCIKAVCIEAVRIENDGLATVGEQRSHQCLNETDPWRFHVGKHSCDSNGFVRYYAIVDIVNR